MRLARPAACHSFGLTGAIERLLRSQSGCNRVRGGVMFCTDCGGENRAEARFCRSCGGRIAAPPAATARPVGKPTLPTAPPPTTHEAADAGVLTVAGYLSIFGGGAVLTIGLATERPLLATAVASALFMIYGGTLVKRHRGAVWLGWLMCGAIGLGVIANGLIPLQIMLWALLAAWAAYVHVNAQREESLRGITGGPNVL
jgi:hypothetical protein